MKRTAANLGILVLATVAVTMVLTTCCGCCGKMPGLDLDLRDQIFRLGDTAPVPISKDK